MSAIDKPKTVRHIRTEGENRMGKNVYAAPRKGPAGKWVEQSGEKSYVKNQEQERQERMKALAAKYKKNTEKKENE